MSAFEEFDPELLKVDPTEGVDVGNCAKCPRVIRCLDSIQAEHTINMDLLSSTADPSSEALVRDAFDAANESGFTAVMQQVSGVEINDSESLIAAMRKAAVNQAEFADDRIKESLLGLGAMTMDCEGPLRMRAAKASRVVTATVCNSPKLFDGSSSEIVHIQRDRQM